MISLSRSSQDPLSCVIFVRLKSRVVAKHEIVLVFIRPGRPLVIFWPIGAVSAVFGYHVHDQRRLFVAEYNFRANVVKWFWCLSSDYADHELSLLSVTHLKTILNEFEANFAILIRCRSSRSTGIRTVAGKSGFF